MYIYFVTNTVDNFSIFIHTWGYLKKKYSPTSKAIQPTGNKNYNLREFSEIPKHSHAQVTI